MSNTCPICFELFLPPRHQPYILFPCGHTFCKICIDSCAKNNKTCPFCRAKFATIAPNLSLQSLVQMANDKNQDYLNQLRQKRDEMVRNGTFSESHNQANSSALRQMSVQHQSGKSIIDAAVDHAHVQKCKEELKLMTIKAEVMREELHLAQTKMHSSREAIKTKEHSLNLLSAEKNDALERLRKV